MRDLEPAESDVLDTSEAGALIVRGGAFRSLAFVATALISLVGVVVLTRYLGPGPFGQYQTIVSLMVLAGGLSDLGMATLGTREYAQRAGQDRFVYMRILLGLRLALTCLGVAGALVFAVVAGYSPALLAGTAFAGFGLLLTVIQTNASTPLGVELRLGTLAVMDVVRQILTSLLIVAVALAGGGVAAVLATAIPVQLFLIVWTWWLVRGKISAIPSGSIAAWKGLMVASVGFALAMASGAVYQNIAQILTSLVAGVEQTGLFSAAFRVFTIVGAVPLVIVSGAFPLLARAARDDVERLRYALTRVTQVSMVVGGACALVAFVGAGPIIEVVGGRDFSGAVLVLRILAVAMLIGFANLSWSYGLLAGHHHRPVLITNLAGLVVMAVLVLVLASSSLGAEGTAMAVVMGEAVIGIGYGIALKRTEDSVALLAAEGVKALLALGISVGVGVALLGFSPVAATAVAAVAYAILLVVLRAIPAEAADLLPGGLRERVPRWMFAD